ncbi:MAG: protein kinase domain-containing protein [Halothermotrichaceae bacterium]
MKGNIEINNDNQLKYYKIEKEGNNLIGDPLFIDYKPKSRVIHSIKKEIDRIIKNQNKLIDHDCYIHYHNLQQINQEYCLIREEELPLIPITQYLRTNEVSIKHKLSWIKKIGEIMYQAEMNDISWKGITLQSIFIDSQSKLHLINPDIIQEIGKYRETDIPVMQEIYRPPEIFKDNKWSQQSRLYSLGIIVYYLLAEKFPFSSKNKSDLIDEILNTRPVEPKYINFNLSSDISELVMKLLEKKPANRYDSWEQFVNRLQEIIETGSYQAAEKDIEINKEKGEKIQKSNRRKFLLRSFFRKNRNIIIITVSIIALIATITVMDQRKPVVTENTDSGQVVEYFYQALDGKNITLLNETTTLNMEELEKMINRVYVIEKVKQAYEGNIAEEGTTKTKVFGITNLKITDISTGSQPVYKAEYTFYYNNNVQNDNNEDNSENEKVKDNKDEIQERDVGRIVKYETQMEDKLIMGNVEGTWQIVEAEGDVQYLIEGNIEELFREINKK